MRDTKNSQIINIISKKIIGTEFENRTFLVGGYVRDFLLGNNLYDIDIVVAIPNGGAKLANLLYRNRLCSKPAIYKKFGTARIEIKSVAVEFVMTRKECYRDRDRKPDVIFGSLIEDAFRRDFTMNALYMNINNREIEDITGLGIEDIKQKVIRATSDGDIIFKEDPLRILRAVRFAGKLDFNIEPITKEAIIRWKSSLEHISIERIKDEFVRMVLEKGTYKSIKICFDFGLMKYIFPLLENDKEIVLKQIKKIHLVEAKLERRLALLFSHTSGNSDVIGNIVKLTIGKKTAKNVANIVRCYQELKVLDIDDSLKFNTFVVSNILYLEEAIKLHKHFNTASRFEVRISQQTLLYEKNPYTLNGRKIMEFFDLKEGSLIGYYSDLAKDIWRDNPLLTEIEILGRLKLKVKA